MGGVLGQLLPLAVGVAVSPVPIIAVILLLLTPRARRPSLGFLAGWLLGITVAVVVVVALFAATDLDHSDGPSTAAAWIRIFLGFLLAFLGVRQWRQRPEHGQEPEPPGWMTAIDSITAGKALGLNNATVLSVLLR